MPCRHLTTAVVSQHPTPDYSRRQEGPGAPGSPATREARHAMQRSTRQQPGGFQRRRPPQRGAPAPAGASRPRRPLTVAFPGSPPDPCASRFASKFDREPSPADIGPHLRSPSGRDQMDGGEEGPGPRGADLLAADLWARRRIPPPPPHPRPRAPRPKGGSEEIRPPRPGRREIPRRPQARSRRPPWPRWASRGAEGSRQKAEGRRQKAEGRKAGGSIRRWPPAPRRRGRRPICP